jgi:hypothetical protein
MKFDFCLVASWGELSQKQIVKWGTELESQGYSVALLTPSPLEDSFDTDIQTFVISGDETVATAESKAEIESQYDIPSLDHLAFTERLYFGFSRAESIRRARRLASNMGQLFSEHSFKYTYQVRGPETHRLLAHYLTKHHGGISIWGDFSPFDGTFVPTTALDGSWDEYRTIPYDEIPEADRETTRKHIEEFREARRFYAHDDEPSTSDTDDGPSYVKHVVDTARDLITRTRPGRVRDQIAPALRLAANRWLNEYLLPSVEQSRRLCQSTDYVFFPLQYPIESRLTVFSPEFYDQSYLIAYLSRILPSSTQLFVKGHPNHPGRPAPEIIHKHGNKNRVRFLNHDLNAHEVIENSEAVVVVNNTVGFETIYHGKPLLTLGEPPYAETPAVTNVESLSRLPEVLNQTISTTVPEQTVIESIYSLREATYPSDRDDLESGAVQTYIDSVISFADSTNN